MIRSNIYCTYFDFTVPRQSERQKLLNVRRKAWRQIKSLFHHWEKNLPLFRCLHQVAKKSKKQSGSATCYSEITLCCMPFFPSLAPLYTHIHTQSSRFRAVIYIKALITIWYTPTKKKKGRPSWATGRIQPSSPVSQSQGNTPFTRAPVPPVSEDSV